MRKIITKIKELYNKAVEKIGLDKITHFSVYGMVVAIAGLFGWIPSLIVFVIMWVLSLLKEGVFDSDTNWWDILAGVSGGLISLILSVIAFFV